MIGKRGDGNWLTGKFIGIFLAVVCLVIFVVFVRKLYYVGVSQESENAKNTLDSIVAKVELVQQGRSNLTLQGFSGAENWYLTAWSSNGARPERCFFENCICLCKGGGKIDNCDETAFCRDLKGFSVSVLTEPFVISGFTRENTQGYENSEYYEDKYAPLCIPLKKNLMSLSLSKSSNVLIFSHIELELSKAESVYAGKCIDAVKG